MMENNYDNQGYVDEGQNNGIRKKRRRKPIQEETNNPQPPEIEVEDSNIPKKEHRRRRRRETKNADDNPQNVGPLGVAAYLEDLQDDIELKVNSDGSIPQMESLTVSKGRPLVSTGTGDKVYIEGTRTFRAQNHDQYMKEQQKLANLHAQQQQLHIASADHSDNALMHCAIGVTERYHIFATFLHGLLAGMMLLHLVFALAVGGTALASQQAFLIGYVTLQQPLAIYYYVALVIILVALWDRVDVGQPSGKCGSSQAGILVALILTMVAFVINNCQYLYNQDFNNFNLNNSRPNLDILVVSYGTWRQLDAVKSVLICASWFIMALIPVYDRFVEHLNACLVQDLNENY